MTTSAFNRIDRRRLVLSSAILGGAAMLTTGQSLRAGAAGNRPAAISAGNGSPAARMVGGDPGRDEGQRASNAATSQEMEITWSLELENYGEIATNLTLAGNALYFSTDDDVILAVDAETGAERWRFPTHGTNTYLNVVDGIVYFGSREDHVYALDAEEGTVLWRFENPGQCTSPQVVDGVVYVGNGDLYLYAFDAKDGSMRWSFPTPNGMSGLTVVEGVVYLGFDESEAICAVSATDGTQLWQYDSNYSYGWSHPSVVDGVVYSKPDETLYAVDAETGRELWKLGVETVFSDNWFGSIVDFAASDGVVYATGDTGDDSIGAFDARSGKELWRSTVEDSENYIVSVSDGVVVAYDSENLFAFEAATGAPLWSVPVIDFNLCCSPTIWEADEQIYIAYRDTLFAVDKSTQEELWRYTADEFLYVIGPSVELGNGVVYCGLGSNSDYLGGQLVALRPATPSLKAGGAARVTVATALRGGPSSTAVVRAELAPGTVVTLTGEAKAAGAIDWWPVTVDDTGDQGWVDASALEPLTSGSGA